MEYLSISSLFTFHESYNDSRRPLGASFLKKIGCFVLEEYGLDAGSSGSVAQARGSNQGQDCIEFCPGAVQDNTSDADHDGTSCRASVCRVYHPVQKGGSADWCIIGAEGGWNA